MKEQEKLAIIIRYSGGVIAGNEVARQIGLTLRQVQNGYNFYLHGVLDDATGITTAYIMMKEETTLGYQLCGG